MILLLLKVTLLLALTLAAVSALRRSSAALRHLLYACGLAGALLLMLTVVAPPGAPVFRIAGIRVPTEARVARGIPGGARALWRGLPWLWLAGTVVLAVRIASGHVRVARLLREAGRKDVTPADVSVPVAAGIWHAKILLPRESESWPAERLDAVLCHERAHIRRHDLQTLLLAELACAVYWFHPLVWMVAARLRREQEDACDDEVILSGFAPDLYAEALLAAARTFTSTELAGCYMTTRKAFPMRVARLLRDDLPRAAHASTLRGSAVLFAGVALAVGLLNGQAQSPDSAGVYRMGAGISAPRVLQKSEPGYTEEARDAKIEGAVVLSIVIGVDGKARDINILKGLGSGLDEKAVDAVQKWQFAPATKDGTPVAARAQIEIHFKLL